MLIVVSRSLAMGCDGYIKIICFGDIPEGWVKVKYVEAYRHNWNFETVFLPPGTRYIKCYHSCECYPLDTSDEKNSSEDEQ